MRVCTKDELLSEICCNTGGNCDNHPVWTSTLEPGDCLEHNMAILVIELLNAYIFQSVLNIDSFCSRRADHNNNNNKYYYYCTR